LANLRQYNHWHANANIANPRDLRAAVRCVIESNIADGGKSRMARHRAVLRCLMQFRLANSLPSSTLSAIQSWKKEIPANTDANELLGIQEVRTRTRRGAR
jgi:hypothetical protein